MPTIANPNPLSHHGHRESPARPEHCAPPMRIRVSAAVHRRSLTRSIAEGADPMRTAELVLRAQQLTNRRNRQTYARTLRRIVAEGHRPAMTRASVVFIRRGAVLDAENLLTALITRLESPAPVAPRGMAELERIVTNADHSPIYEAREPGSLRHQLAAALYAMETHDGRAHEFGLGR